MKWTNILLSLAAASLVFSLAGCSKDDYPKVEQGRTIAFNKDTKEVTLIHDSAMDPQKPVYDVLPPSTFKLPTDPAETGPEPKAGGRLKLDTVKKEIELYDPKTQKLVFLPINILAGIGGMSEWTMMIGGKEHWPLGYTLFCAGLAVIGVAFAYQKSRYGRLLRATREDPAAAQAVGTSVYRQRLLAFALSGALAGFAGALFIHLLPLTIQEMYLSLTLLTLAMLVVGGMSSLWGAVVGALAVSGLDSLFAVLEGGVSIGSWSFSLPTGTRLVAVSAVMALVLIVRPTGLFGRTT